MHVLNTGKHEWIQEWYQIQVEGFQNTPRFSTSSTSLFVGIKTYPQNYGPYCAIRTAGQSCSEESITISFAALLTTILLAPQLMTHMALWQYD